MTCRDERYRSRATAGDDDSACLNKKETFGVFTKTQMKKLLGKSVEVLVEGVLNENRDIIHFDGGDI